MELAGLVDFRGIHLVSVLPFEASPARLSGEDYGSSTNSLKRGYVQKVLRHSELCWVAFQAFRILRRVQR